MSVGKNWHIFSSICTLILAAEQLVPNGRYSSIGKIYLYDRSVCTQFYDRPKIFDRLDFMSRQTLQWFTMDTFTHYGPCGSLCVFVFLLDISCLWRAHTRVVDPTFGEKNVSARIDRKRLLFARCEEVCSGCVSTDDCLRASPNVLASCSALLCYIFFSKYVPSVGPVRVLKCLITSNHIISSKW